MTGLARFFDSYYRLRPVNATFTGVHRFDHRLPDWSPDGLAAARDEMCGLRASLDGVDPAADLRDTAPRDRALAVSFLDVQIAELDGGHFQRGNPSLAAGEAAFAIVSLITRPFAPAAERLDAIVGRLEALPGFLDGARGSITGGVPAEWRRKAQVECDGALRVVGDGVRRWLALESLSDRRVDAAAERACSAIERFRAWLAADAAAAGDERYSIGPETLDLLIARGHWCTIGRHDLRAAAQAALDEALDALDRRARAAAPGGWPEVQARLATRHPSAADYLHAFQRTWEACRARAVEARLVTWPEWPIRYVPIPPQTRDAAPLLYYLFYRSPAPYDRLPVHDYVVTPIEGVPADEQERRLRAANCSVITLNHVVHHGAIGHHVQNYRAYAGDSEVGRVAAVDCASRIGMFLGGTMAEGWACYATDLMDEIGFLTPDESLAQQHTRARLAARAVVDIGLHERSLSFDDAVAVYRDRIGMTPEAARAEACKNSMFPGTALMYWLGTDRLHRLRTARRRADGSGFDLQRFHDRLLSFGSIPVPLIERIW
jgi:uncharacterized protein (DUF885 family)